MRSALNGRKHGRALLAVAVRDHGGADPRFGVDGHDDEMLGSADAGGAVLDMQMTLLQAEFQSCRICAIDFYRGSHAGKECKQNRRQWEARRAEPAFPVEYFHFRALL